jgi:hypothetical protein
VSVRVHRLVVTYPEGSHDADGIPVPDWEPERGWTPAGAYDIEEGPPSFSWPRPRLFLSMSGATGRANLLRYYGATVEVQSSRPVEWDGDGS